MRFRENAQLDASEVSDRRGVSGRGLAVGGGGLGVVGLLVVVLVQVLGGSGGDAANVLDSFSGANSGSGVASSDLSATCRTGADANAKTECAVLAEVNSIQDYWTGQLGSDYTETDTVFFADQISTGCGAADSGVGPFYCPADALVYIDLTFFDELQQKFGAEGGTFVDAYVLAHEYGHHVQDLLGTNKQVGTASGASSGSVRLELQADCYAGAWANHATTVPDDSGSPLISEISDDDVSRALDAASRIGDDFIQQNLGDGTADPDSYTHGTSAQRQKWFTAGYRSGDPEQCDTFAATSLG